MESKNLRKLFVGTLIAMNSLALSATFAWFRPVASIDKTDSPLEGITEGAYFAYGDGSSQKPYGISKYRHLYNLAWLQYLGFFSDKQYYFELANDLDMNGFVIPPIGTTEYPFTSSFNGQNYIISNFTVSNDYSDYTKHPSVVTADNYKSDYVKIVGFFGVVGNYNNAFTASGATYSSSVNTIANTGLVDFTVTTVATDTLVGMVAGYVSATITNVAVDAATVNVEAASTTAFDTSITKHVSDYSIIGYTTTKQQVKEYKSTIYNVSVESPEDDFVVDEQSNTAGWGGSLNMVEMYDDLKSVWNNFTSGSTPGGQNHEQYVYEREIYKDVNGVEDLTKRVERKTAHSSNFGSGTYYNYYGYEQKNTNNKVTASYNFVIDSTATLSNEQKYMCLSGERSVSLTGTDLTTITHDYTDFLGHRVSYNNNYLSFSGTTVQNETTANNAKTWIFDSAAKTFYSIDSDGGVIYLTCNSSGNLSMTTTESAIWYYDSTLTAYYALVSNSRHYLGINGTTWTTQTYNPTISYYELYDKNQSAYLYARGTNSYVGTTRTQGTNCRWTLNSNGRFVPVDYSSVTLRTYPSGSTYYLVTINSTSYTEVIYDGSKFTRDGTTIYLYAYNNNGTQSGRYSTDSSYASRLEVRPTYSSSFSNTYHSSNIVYSTQTYTGGKVPRTTTETTTATLDTKPTYFPLKHENGVPLPENTGYVVSGANAHSTNDPYGDIRVSKYDAGSGNSHLLRNSINTSTHNLSTVYTINASTTANSPTTLPTDLNNKDETTNNKYPRYYKALKNMNKALNDDTSAVYGLHFMKASIGGSNGNQRVTVGEAVINGSDPMPNYQLPTDCIDFNLKEKGAITFFAGTYFVNGVGSTKNDSFFALYDIQRDSNHAITSLKEITAIYKKNNDESADYVYQYSGNNQYSISGFSASNYTKIFDTSWIKKQSSAGSGNYIYRYYAAYYFEIPVNEGEYCLGSDTNGIGAYLMYLDIGANAQKLHRTIIGEHITTVEKTFEYPAGVAFVEQNNIATTLNSSTGVDPKNSACVTVYPAYSGTYEMDRSSSNNNEIDIDVSVSGTSSKIKAGYVYDQISLHDPGGVVTARSAILTKTTEKYITEFFDYDAIKQETTRSIITRTVVSAVDENGTAVSSYASDTRSYAQKTKEDSATVWTDAGSNFVIYNSATGEAYTNNAQIPLKDADTKVILIYDYLTRLGLTATETDDLLAALVTATSEFTPNGYNVDIKSSGTTSSDLVTIGVTTTGYVSGITVSSTNGQNGVKVVTVTVSGGYTYTITLTPSITATTNP